VRAGDECFERCCAGVPKWFAGNAALGSLAAGRGTVVIGTEEGCVFL